MKKLILLWGIVGYSVVFSQNNPMVQSSVYTGKDLYGQQFFITATYSFDKELGQFVVLEQEKHFDKQEKNLYFYNEKGENIRSQSFVWDNDKNDWQKTKEFRVLEEKGNKRIEEKWWDTNSWHGEASEEKWENTQEKQSIFYSFKNGKWVPAFQNIAQKDKDSNHYTQIIYKQYNALKNNWQNTTKIESQKSNNISTEITYEWNKTTQQWESYTKNTTTKNAHTEIIEEYLRKEGKWVIKYKNTKTKDPKTGETTTISGDFTNEEVYQTKMIEKHDLNGNKLYTKIYEWNAPKADWEIASRIEYQYNSAGKLTQMQTEQHKQTQVYNENGDVILVENFYKDNKNAEWKSSNRTEYIYHKTLKIKDLKFYPKTGIITLPQSEYAILEIKETYFSNEEDAKETTFKTTYSE